MCVRRGESSVHFCTGRWSFLCAWSVHNGRFGVHTCTLCAWIGCGYFSGGPCALALLARRRPSSIGWSILNADRVDRQVSFVAESYASWSSAEFSYCCSRSQSCIPCSGRCYSGLGSRKFGALSNVHARNGATRPLFCCTNSIS